MQLKRRQKRELLKWIAEGLQSDEINERAATFEPPFEVSRQQVDYYRKTRRVDLDTIAKIDEKSALIEGYAAKEHRVYKLSMLAALLECDLLGGFLWLDQVKAIGSGDIAQIVEYEEFNKAEIDAYRGVLDDIAKEVGGRVTKQEVSGAGGGAITVKVTRDDDAERGS
jgi:hypothetical protein